ncbi:ABC transporter permease subunit [Bosea sp. 2KB_26]|uniref:ABC transporter permease subunit n=1 Tax=Bosea sp. 2KB_26 TaxID=3237475 RepID=UPI003F8EF01C
MQAIPRGQLDAAKALGLSHRQALGLVLLPRAVTLTIPSQVNILISAFKDTSLVAVIGMAARHSSLGRSWKGVVNL